ncbi:MAG TPA: transcription-repair coupling factor, partial [Clostridia bacterium]|nr:transcription-repair coupling factor [Clostridia bacterium]
ELSTGDRIEPDKLLHQLAQWGYERLGLVEGHGQFSVRGGIVDVFPLTSDQPVRIEFFDDEVDSIREFSVDTQRTEKMLGEVYIGPARELIIEGNTWGKGYNVLKAEYDRQVERFKKRRAFASVQELADSIAGTLEAVKEHHYFDGIELFSAYFYEKPSTLFDYLSDHATCLVVEPYRVMEAVQAIEKEREDIFKDLLANGKVLPGQYTNYVSWHQFTGFLRAKNSFYFSLLPREPNFIKTANKIPFNAKTVGGFLGRPKVIAGEIRLWQLKGNSIVVLVSSDGLVNRIQNGFLDSGIEAHKVETLKGNIHPGKVIIAKGYIEKGFEFPSAQLVLLTETEILGQKKTSRPAKSVRADSQVTERDLEKGDYVVHVNHGIGRYMGIVPLKVGDVQKDYLLVRYAGQDKLYVPTDQVDLLQKYVGSEGHSPRLSRLGSAEWAKVKNRVSKVVKEIAQDLLELYASRQAMPGFLFSRDTMWQRDFESAFPYEETRDQVKAIEEVKFDMEKPQPMDRLLCGDVGYGKTEVALRAAFKSVMDGKQVAVLVPTTILAQQHYNTFRERFANYPVNVEMLSRFRTPAKQQKVLEGLKLGIVDIVIGTHRLVQDDVMFKDLGLLVVDEEQRFGVGHKEKLKMMRKNVDVLTLTATPIPRTLHMSLVGARDTSILETPPEERFPVQTYVMEEDPLIIREAISRELNRDGQVYFVYNRVQDLDRVASWVSDLVPDARIAVAHGQMREDKLEQVMLDFMEKEYDILVCTTIIENGLDIQNVNTLIIKEADMLGLAQLYQLRGRVGRSNRLAYAYITFRKDKMLNEAAEKRLLAIKQFTDFGSGFKLAMRDLEIRGAGNLLGIEQHGHIAAIGYDLYCRMLENAVKEAKGEPVEREFNTTVELNVDAYIPEDYIEDQRQKVDIYKRIAATAELDGVEELKDELLDRYGDLPGEVLNLLQVARVKTLGKILKIKSITRSGNYYKFTFDQGHELSPDNLVKLGEEYADAVKFKAGEDFTIMLIARTGELETLFSLERIEAFLGKMA